MPSRIVDAHIHLTEKDFFNTLSYLLFDAKTTGKILFSVAVDVASSKANLSFLKDVPDFVKIFIGIHPHFSVNEDAQELINIAKKFQKEISGIGEIGLDGKYNNVKSSNRKQRDVFLSLLSIAESLKKPVSIHSRNATDEVMEIISSYTIPAVLLHWFSGDLIQLKKGYAQGYYFSFGPAAVYSKKIRELASATPLDLILTETDGPVKFGSCFSAKQAVPAFIPSILFSLSSCLSMSYDDLVTQVYENSINYLGQNI